MMKTSEGLETKLALQMFHWLDDSGATFPQARTILALVAKKVEAEERAASPPHGAPGRRHVQRDPGLTVNEEPRL